MIILLFLATVIGQSRTRYSRKYHKIWGDLPGFDIPNRNHDRSSPDYPTSYSSYNSDPYEEYFYDAPLASIDAHSMSAQRQTILYRNIPIVISGPDETVSRYENQKNILIVKQRKDLPLHEDIRWTCPVNAECFIRAFTEDNKSYVNIFENDIDGIYMLNAYLGDLLVYNQKYKVETKLSNIECKTTTITTTTTTETTTTTTPITSTTATKNSKRDKFNFTKPTKVIDDSSRIIQDCACTFTCNGLEVTEPSRLHECIIMCLGSQEDCQHDIEQHNYKIQLPIILEYIGKDLFFDPSFDTMSDNKTHHINYDEEKPNKLTENKQLKSDLTSIKSRRNNLTTSTLALTSTTKSKTITFTTRSTTTKSTTTKSITSTSATTSATTIDSTETTSTIITSTTTSKTPTFKPTATKLTTTIATTITLSATTIKSTTIASKARSTTTKSTTTSTKTITTTSATTFTTTSIKLTKSTTIRSTTTSTTTTKPRTTKATTTTLATFKSTTNSLTTRTKSTTLTSTTSSTKNTTKPKTTKSTSTKTLKLLIKSTKSTTTSTTFKRTTAKSTKVTKTETVKSEIQDFKAAIHKISEEFFQESTTLPTETTDSTKILVTKTIELILKDEKPLDCVSFEKYMRKISETVYKPNRDEKSCCPSIQLTFNKFPRASGSYFKGPKFVNNRPWWRYDQFAIWHNGKSHWIIGLFRYVLKKEYNKGFASSKLQTNCPMDIKKWKSTKDKKYHSAISNCQCCSILKVKGSNHLHNPKYGIYTVDGEHNSNLVFKQRWPTGNDNYIYYNGGRLIISDRFGEPTVHHGIEALSENVCPSSVQNWRSWNGINQWDGDFLLRVECANEMETCYQINLFCKSQNHVRACIETISKCRGKDIGLCESKVENLLGECFYGKC